MSDPEDEPHHAEGQDFAAVVAGLRSVRLASHKSRYGDRNLPGLPSRTATIALVNDVIGAVFPRHFGPQDLTDEHLDAYIGATVAQACATLARQAFLELQLADAAPHPDLAGRARGIATSFIEALPGLRSILETDIRAAYEGDPAATSLDEVMCCYPGVSAIIRHRLAHKLYLLGAPMLARIVSEDAHSTTGIDIHPGADIGESFFIDHGTGVVIGETAIIGRRARLYQAVTLGAKRFEVDEAGALIKRYPRHPIIEDDVVIYAGATILGRIVIGRGSTIAGNVWLAHGVPPGSVITQAKVQTAGFSEGDGI